MSKIFIPNIFITTNFSKVRKYFLDVASPSRDYSIPSNTTDDSLLITPENNKYLQSFEFSLNYQDKNATKLVLSFIDVDDKFEESFLNSSVIKNYIEHALENSIKKSDYYANNPELFSTAIRNQLKVYFAFGVGSDLKEWAGPYCATLIKSELTISNTGLRNYKYTFLPSNSYMFKPRLTSDETNPNPYSDIAFNFVNFRTRGEVNVPNTKSLMNVGDVIKRLLKDYIRNVVSSNNIIVMIPKINEEIIDQTVNAIGLGVLQSKTLRSDRINDLNTFIKDTPTLNTLLGRDEDFYYETKTEKLDTHEYAAQLYRRLGITLSLNNLPGSNGIKEVDNPTYSAKSVGKASFYNQIRQEVLKSKFDVTGMSLIDNRFQDGWTAVMEANTADLSEKEEAAFRKGGAAPNWWKPLYKLETGLQSCIKGFVGKIVCFQESDLRILKLWKKYGLIKDDQSPCTVVGIDQFIYDTLYCNQSDISRILEFKSKYNFENDDPLKKILDANEYKLDLVKIFYKNKNNSSFDEKIVLDELNFNNTDFDVLKQQVEAAKITDIPVFTNNLKNSNILSLSVDLGDTYFAVTQTAVHNDLRKFFADTLLSNNKRILDSTLTPGELKEVKDFIETNLDWNEKISDEDLTTFTEGGIALRNSKLKRQDELKKYLDLIGQEEYDKQKSTKYKQEYDKETKDVISYYDASINEYKRALLGIRDPDTRAGYQKSIENFEKQKQEYLEKAKKKEFLLKAQQIENEYNGILKNQNAVLKPYVHDKPESEITYLNLAVVKKFREMKNAGKLNGVEPGAFLNLAMFIVMSNQLNKLNPSIVATPKHGGASSKSIAGLIFDYLYKYNLLLNIRTIPFFNISSWKSIPKPAIVVSKKLHTLGGIKNDPDYFKEKNVFDFFSGIYSIQGFKHVINTKEAYSEFFLLKNNLGLPDIAQINKNNKP